ncbi:hypothetical protein EPO33_04460 [Patescibacteria group bacterium]|nr:MAG: hypothetical protein EPO33_04460 [Patescibacteria group bacterium]
MQAFLAQFPFTDESRRFMLTLSVAAGIGLAAIGVGLAFLPVPASPTDEFTGGARVAVTLPPGATLLNAADILEPLFPAEAGSVRVFASHHPELAAALKAEHGGRLTMYGPHVSGTAQFVLTLSGQSRKALLPSLGRAFPQEVAYELPDGRRAYELVADPEAAEAQLSRVPGTDWLLFGSATSSLPLALREDNENLEITTFPVEWLVQISARFPAGRSFCLNGVPAAVPVRLESRWKTFRAPMPGFVLPLVAPRPRSSIPIDGITDTYRNFCGILG